MAPGQHRADPHPRAGERDRLFFDRNPDGTVLRRPLPGSFDRTVHKGDLTASRSSTPRRAGVAARRAAARGSPRARSGSAADGSGSPRVHMLDMRTGEPLMVRARATLLAPAAGRRCTFIIRRSATSRATAWRSRCEPACRCAIWRWCSSIRPDAGGAAHADDRQVLEEGLRGSGRICSTDRRALHVRLRSAPRARHATSSRGVADRIREGHTSPNGGVYISMGHSARTMCGASSRAWSSAAPTAASIAGGKVEVIPTAHYMMGGVQFDGRLHDRDAAVYAAGEDTGGVHGANRLGGNGVANSTVFGGLAGDSMAGRCGATSRWPIPTSPRSKRRTSAPTRRSAARQGDLESVRRRLYQVMWDEVGILRTAEGLSRARHELNNLATSIAMMGVADTEKRYNLTWMDRLNLENLVLVSRADLRRRAGPRRQPRRALPRGLSGNLGTCRLALHRRPRGGRQLQGRDRTGRLHPRSSRPIAVCAGGGMTDTVPANGERTM